MVSKEIIDEIKARTDVLDVISDYVDLKKAGSNYRGMSPFNNERTPSFYVVPSKGFFKDFSSGKAGDGITFLMEAEGMSYMEAIQHLAKKYGIELEEDEPTEEELIAKNERESLFIIMKFAAQYFQDKLWKDDEGKAVALPYFKERGFSEDTIRNFDLGYSLDIWDGLIKEAQSKSYSTELLEKAGLVIRKENNKIYDRFRGRVMFPIHSLTGRVIAFGARILSKGSNPKFDQPKYINSPETDIYHKSHVLYGIFQAKQAIRQEDYCFLVEGYTDVISMHQAGIHNVVASSGTSLTHEQIKLISRYTKNITVLFDGDAAGIKASIRGIDMILEGGLNVKAVVLPEGEDPDSHARNLGGADFVRYTKENQQDFIRFKVGLYQSEARQDPMRKAAVIREIVTSISKMPDPIQRQVYIKESSELLDMDESILITELNKIHLQQQQSVRQKAQYEDADVYDEQIPDIEPEPEEKGKGIIYYKEKEITRILVQYGHLEVEEGFKVCHYIFQELEDIKIQTDIYQKIHTLYQQQASNGITVTDTTLINAGIPEVEREVIDMVVNHYVLSENWELRYNIIVNREETMLNKAIMWSIQELKMIFLNEMIEDIRRQLQGNPDVETENNLIRQQMLYKNSQQEIAKNLGIVIF